MKCLVVDDHRDGAQAMGELLKILGAGEVLIVHSGAEAIGVAAGFQPGMVVLDINMPGLDGFETRRLLGQQPWSRDALFIAHTGMPRSEEEFRAAGFHHVVWKGDSPHLFETVLRKFAQRERSAPLDGIADAAQKKVAGGG